MASFDDILKEVQYETINTNSMSAPDVVRRKYMQKLSELTSRPVIAYYSAFQQKPHLPDIQVSDSDMQGFMNAVKDLDRSNGLDLILHTPGGDPSAAESIVDYLRDMFGNDIRVIVPHMAMSAGTMIACSSRVILMGKHSFLGPVDPQILGQSAFNLKKEFEDAEADLLKNPANQALWHIRLSKMPVAILQFAENAIKLSETLVTKWLGTSMFDISTDRAAIDKIAEALNSNHSSYIHSRHLGYEQCIGIGLKVEMIEDNQDLQDAILSLHHAMLFTLSNTPTFKVIENSIGRAYIRQETPNPFNMQMIQQPQMGQILLQEQQIQGVENGAN